MLPVRVRFWRRGLSLAASLALSAGLYGQMGGFYASQNANADAAPVNVAGIVVNANTGAPVARALVQLGSRAMLTDHDGKFEFDQFTSQNADIQVTKPGYYFSLDVPNGGGHRLTSDQLTAPLRLRLYPEALLTGTVTADDGLALEGVPVAAMRSTFDESGRRWIPQGQTTTNARGEFRLPVPAGEYKIETRYVVRRNIDNDVIMPMQVPAYTSTDTSGAIRVHSGEEQHFDLHPLTGKTYLVSATVEGEGTPQGFPMIRVRMANGMTFPANFRPRSGGLDYLINLPSGTYTLTGMKNTPDGLETAQVNVTVADHDVSGIVLQFSPAPALPVELRLDPTTSDNGKGSSAGQHTVSPAMPTPGSLGLMLLNTHQDMDWGMSSVYPTVQKDGTWVFRVPPGSYRLVARNNSWQWYVESASCGDRDLLRQDLEIAQGAGGLPIELTVSNQFGTLTGNVWANGRVGNSSRILLRATTPSAAPVISRLSSGDGTYRVNLPPGSYRVVAFEHEHWVNLSDSNSLAPYASHVKTVEIRAGEQTTLDLDAVTDEEMQP